MENQSVLSAVSDKEGGVYELMKIDKSQKRFEQELQVKDDESSNITTKPVSDITMGSQVSLS